MDCNDLTPEEAVGLYYDSLPIDYGKRRRDTHEGRFHIKHFRTKQSNTAVSGDFRGFLKGSSWVIYVGDNYQLYWSVIFRLYGGWDIHDKSRYRLWSEFDIGNEANEFGGGPMYDITDLVCKGGKDDFINWNVNPFEVKL